MKKREAVEKDGSEKKEEKVEKLVKMRRRERKG